MSKLTKAEQKIYDRCLGQCTQCFLVKADCKLRIKIKDIKTVNLIARNYGWVCPDCNWCNFICEQIAIVKCCACGAEFQTKRK